MLTLFALTLFVSSALLFLVQPMFAKLVLPLLGGTPTVWNTCVVFFQAMLLAGYAYAHLTTAWLGVKRQAALHVVIVLLPAFVLPIALRANWVPPTDSNPMAWLLGLLLISVGLPFFVVSSTAPLLQKWFSMTRHRSSADPYFLYMASNAGSMLALLSYPVLLEPTLRLQEQSSLWTAGYGAMALLIAACAGVVHFTARRAPHSSSEPPVLPELASYNRPSPTLRLRWIALAAVPSSLMLGVTTFLSTDIAAVPLLWIVPLALYLGTFIVAFSAAAERVQPTVDRLLPLVLLPLVLLFITQTTQPASLVMPLHVLAFAVLALVCHLELAASRPSTAHLTEFYLWISVGGLLGGVFNTILAPLVFVTIAEYPIAIVLACLLRVTHHVHVTATRGRLTVAAAGVLSVAAGVLAQQWSLDSKVWLAMLGAAVMVSFSISRHASYFAAAVAVMLAAGAVAKPTTGEVLHAERTFFGVYRVINDSGGEYRSLFHGTTLHGRQSRDPARVAEPLTYYHRSGPIGQVLTALAGPLERGHIGAVGLGTGSLAAYAGPEQRWTFYEIDPAVVRIARDPRFFTYMHNAGRHDAGRHDAGAAISVVQGDARLALSSSPRHGHDLLILDAFSSDAIPVHLITREALAVYLNALATKGVLAFHISNRHLSLLPVLARLAAEQNLTALTQFDISTSEATASGKTSSRWVVMARSGEDLLPLTAGGRWVRPDFNADQPVWTDDFSNIISILNRF